MVYIFVVINYIPIKANRLSKYNTFNEMLKPVLCCTCNNNTKIENTFIVML